MSEAPGIPFRKEAEQASLTRGLGKPSSSGSIKLPSFMRSWVRKLTSRPHRSNPVKLVYQTAPNECAPACLVMAARSLGVSVTLAEVSTQFGSALRGVGLRQLIDVARTIGLRARPVRVGLRRIADLHVPSILHWNMNHFVVLISADDDTICVADPGTGIVRLSYEEASSSFTGVALELRRDMDAVLPDADVRPKPILPLLSWTSLLKRRVAAVVSVLLVIQISSLSQPFLLRSLSEVLSGQSGALVWQVLAGMLVIVSVQFCASISRTYAVEALGRDVSEQFSVRLMRHILALSSEFVGQRIANAVAIHVQSMESVRKTIVESFLPAAVDLVILVAAIAFMVFFSPIGGLVVLGGITVEALVKASGFQMEKQGAARLLDGQAAESLYLYETIRGFQTVKLNSAEAIRLSVWESKLVDVFNANNALVRRRALSNAISAVVMPIEFAILVLVASPTMTGGIGIAVLFGIFAFRSIVREKVSSLLALAPSFFSLSEQLSRLRYIRIAPPEITPGAAPVPLGRNDISLANLSFSYSSNDPAILRDINLTIRAGEFVAIIGRSGVGKSTLVKLILGLVQPAAGTMSYGSTLIDGCNLSNWRRNFSSVLQDDLIFNGSIAENIGLFESVIDMTAVIDAAKLAHIDDEILEFPMGYATVIGEGMSIISAGQRQRILIARSIYRRAPVLVFDEGTAHVDSRCEEKIADSISSMNSTRIVIAHRSSLIERADRVFELANGSLTEIGKPHRK